MWEERMKMILNEYRLLPFQKEAQTLVAKQMEEFFFGDGAALRRGSCQETALDRPRPDQDQPSERDRQGATCRRLPRPRRPCIRSLVLRSPARPLDALLHRDVGALQLLRDARLPHPVHDRAGRRSGGMGLDDGGRRADLRHLHLDGVSDELARRLDRRPAASASGAPCSTAASSSRRATSRSPFRRSSTFYLGLVLDRARHRPAQAQHQRHRRPAVRAERRRAATPGFSIFYMGINLGALLGPLVTGYLAQSRSSGRGSPAWGSIRTPPGTGDSAPPASA